MSSSRSPEIRGLEPLDRAAMRRLSVSAAPGIANADAAQDDREIEAKLIEEEKDEIVGELTPPVSVAQRRRSVQLQAAPRLNGNNKLPPQQSAAVQMASIVASKSEQLASAALAKAREGSDLMVKALRGEAEEGPTVEDPMLGFMNYDSHMDIINEMHLENDSKAKRHHLSLLLLKFSVTLAIALFTAATMYVVSNIASFCFNKKVNSTIALIQSGSPAAAYFQFVGISLLLTAIASILVTFVAPNARGGGVPYALAYLNGTNVSNFFSFRIVGIKAAALGFTIAGGLTLGMEGPFVFLGGGIAILLSKALDRLPAFSSQGKYTRILRNIKEERVFMSGGLAAGLAVAFSAPIAGILFALEGATAFLTVPVTLRIFGCSMFAMFFYDLSRAGFSYNIKSHNVIEIVHDSDQAEYAWMVPEILSFTVLAIIGGLLGAIAVKINVKITKWRHHHMEGKVYSNIAEVALITLITASCWFALPWIFGCRPQPDFCEASRKMGEERCIQAFCPEGQYTEIGSVVFSGTDVIVRNLFDRSVAVQYEFDPWPLLVYGVCYLLLVSWVYGAYVPGGLFVPSIVIGGVYGRIVGYIGKRYIASYISPGIYSMLGAAGMLGGFTRLALPVVVMLIEMTGDATYLLPIMYIATTAKLLADYLEPPLYPQHMQLEGIPTLGDVLKPNVARMTAKELMNPHPVSLLEVDRVGHVLEVLKRSKATLLPVTDQQHRFVGIIMRTSVIYALNNSPFHESAQDVKSSEAHRGSQLLSVEKEFGDWADTTDYAATLHGFDSKLQDSLISLAPFMDSGALTCRENSSAKRVAALFRRVGLSHVCVCDEQNKLVGVITRRHLIQGGPQLRQQSSLSLHSHSRSGSVVAAKDEEHKEKKEKERDIIAERGSLKPAPKVMVERQDSESKFYSPSNSPVAAPLPDPALLSPQPAPLAINIQPPSPLQAPALIQPPEPEQNVENQQTEEEPAAAASQSPIIAPSSPPAAAAAPPTPQSPPSVAASAASKVSGGLFSQPSAEELAARESIQARARAKKAALEAKLAAAAAKKQ